MNSSADMTGRIVGSPTMLDEEITLPEAAHRAGLTWHQAHRRATSGAFGAVRQVAGRWLVTAAGVAAYIDRVSQLATIAAPTNDV